MVDEVIGSLNWDASAAEETTAEVERKAELALEKVREVKSEQEESDAPETIDIERPGEYKIDLKGLLEGLAANLHLELNFVAENYYKCLTPGRAAAIMLDNQVVGCVGQLHHEVAEIYDLDQEVLLFEIALAPLLTVAAATATTYRGLARYPAVYRDLAFLVEASLPAVDLLDYIRNQHKLLIGAEVFDVFQGEALSAGKKSLAFRLTFQDMNKTLTDKKVNAIITKLIKGIEDTFHGEVR